MLHSQNASGKLNPNRAYIIASVQTPAMSASQAEAEHAGRIAHLSAAYGVDVVSLEGAYKGAREPSMAIDAADWPSVAHLFNNQESVLFVDRSHYRFPPGRRARLIYVGTGRFEPLGNFQGVSAAEAINSEAYTRHGGKYFVCK